MIFRENMKLIPKKETHQNGEHDLEIQPIQSSPIPVDTFNGRIHVEWDPEASVTPNGQMPFFTEFLKTAGLFDSWVSDCPLNLSSNNASSVRDILGTVFLSILSGHTRYAHITTLRSDRVNPPMLGMKKVVSEDTARRAIKKFDEKAGCEWLERHLKKSYLSLLSIPWIMDIDATVKTLYGNQEGAEVGYNPKKPGRPSHTYHTYHIANIRMILDVEVESGKHGAACYSAPKLWQLLDELPKEAWPAFIRGDASYGNETIMQASESRELKYLFKLKCTTNVKRLIAKMVKERDWDPVGQGWEGVESELRLSGWSLSRHVVLLRKKMSSKRMLANKKSKKQQQLELFFDNTGKDVSDYEYQVLVTNLSASVSTIAQHYRDRADCENNFDELKNQWGWCGYTTKDLKRCRLMSKITALIYNWWNIFTRLANPNAHLEAITSRPLLLNAVGKQTSHAGQTKLTITSTHSKAKKVSLILSRISKFFNILKGLAEQLTAEERFLEILMTAFRKFLPKNRLGQYSLILDTG